MSTSNNTPQIAIDKIHVGKRHRREMGDLADLKASLQGVGMLHPIVVDPEHNLIAGARRLKAAKALGWKHVPVRVVDNLKDATAALTAERDENQCRKAFTRSEATALYKALKALEAPAAKKRQGTRTDRHPGKLPRSARGRAKDKAAKAAGFSRRTAEKAAAVVDAAEHDPATFGPLRDEMDRTGNVDQAYRKLLAAQSPNAGASTAPPDEERIDATFDGDAVLLQHHPSSASMVVASQVALKKLITTLQRITPQWANAGRKRPRANQEAATTAESVEAPV